MIPNPYDRLKRMQPMAQSPMAPELPQMQPAQGMPMQYISGAGDEAGGGEQGGGYGNIGALLGEYLKKRQGASAANAQGASAADAKAAFEAGGSL